MENDAKSLDPQKIEDFLAGKESVLVKDIIENSGASKMRVYPLLFEMQLENKLMVLDESDFGSPIRVASLNYVRPENPFCTEFLDALMEMARKNPRKRMNYNLHDSLEAPAQRLIYALDEGTEFTIHRHTKTSETYVMLRGAMDLVYYDQTGRELHRETLSAANGVLGGQTPAGQYHSLEVKEPSIILLVKDGPYSPDAQEDIITRRG